MGVENDGDLDNPAITAGPVVRGAALLVLDEMADTPDHAVSGCPPRGVTVAR